MVRTLLECSLVAPVCHSVHRGGGCLVRGGVWSRGGRGPGPGGWSQGGAWSRGLVPGGCLVLVGGGAGPRGVPGGDPLPGTATAADGTHPTGMHSCVQIFLQRAREHLHFGVRDSQKAKYLPPANEVAGR